MCLAQVKQGHSPDRAEVRGGLITARAEALQGVASLPSLPFSPSNLLSQHFCLPGLSDEQHVPQTGLGVEGSCPWTEIFPLAASPATAAPAMQRLGVFPAPGVQHRRRRRHHCSLLPPTQPLCKCRVSVLLF